MTRKTRSAAAVATPAARTAISDVAQAPVATGASVTAHMAFGSSSGLTAANPKVILMTVTAGTAPPIQASADAAPSATPAPVSPLLPSNATAAVGNATASIGVPIGTAATAPNTEKVSSWAKLFDDNRKPFVEVFKLYENIENTTVAAVSFESEVSLEDEMQNHSLIGIFPTKFPGREAVLKFFNSWTKKC